MPPVQLGWLDGKRANIRIKNNKRVDENGFIEAAGSGQDSNKRMALLI
jgi:hypothetical protein